MTREVDSIIAYGLAAKTGCVVTDINSPGVHTAGGDHYKGGTPSASGTKGRAVDFGGSGTHARGQELSLALHFLKVEHRLSELIYSPLGFSIKHGRRVNAYAVAGHWKHVHVSVPFGEFLPDFTPPSLDPQEDEMPQPFTLMAPSGRGRWTLFPNGDVHTTNFDDKNPIPFHGAMGDVPNERKPGRIFTNMQMQAPQAGQAPSDSDGYWIFSADKGAFGFKKR